MGMLKQRSKTLRAAYMNNTYRDLNVYKKSPPVLQAMLDSHYEKYYAPTVVSQSSAAPATTLEDNSPDAESSEDKKTLRRRKGKNGLMVSGGDSGNTGINL